MASAAMAPCGCGAHPYHNNKMIDGNAYVRCEKHSLNGKRNVYPMTEGGELAWCLDRNNEKWDEE